MANLIIVPTPVGNLEDITLRAIRILKEVDLILAEDTRTTSVLLKHYDIRNKMQSYHQFNERKTVQHLALRMLGGERMALVSDAGTPGICDAGFLLVRECMTLGVAIECLPGATAFVPALIVSGLPCERFCFEGFLPHKKGRKTRLEDMATERRTMIFYEAPFRLLKTLQQLAEHLSDERQATVSREISKLHEETARGTLKELISHFSNNEMRGECVIIIEGLN